MAAGDSTLCFCSLENWELESGHVIKNLKLAYRTWGRLSEHRSNAIVVCHDWLTDTNVKEWWGPLFGKGHALDACEYFIVCVNSLGSPFGSESPSTTPQDEGRGSNHGPHFPLTTIRDDARAQLALVRHALKVESVFAAIGAGSGGMTALEWACIAGDYVKSVVSIGSCIQQGAWAIAWGETVRNNIFLDPAYEDGYYELHQQPTVGLEAAIRTVSLSRRSGTRSADEFVSRRRNSNISSDRHSFSSSDDETRMNREWSTRKSHMPSRQYSADLRSQQDEKRVNETLRTRELARKFDANCLVALTRKLDTHDLFRDRESHEDVCRLFASSQRPMLVVGNQSDWLHPVQEQEELADMVEGSELTLLDGIEGHELGTKSLEELDVTVTDFFNRVQR